MYIYIYIYIYILMSIYVSIYMSQTMILRGFFYLTILTTTYICYKGYYDQ